MELCRPASEASLAERFQRDLVGLGHQSTIPCVVHGDATQANMLVADRARAVTGLISFALWVAGRTEQPAITLDTGRVRDFVAGYHRVRPLSVWAVGAIPLYLVGRGLQMYVRLDRAGVRDETQSKRLHWLDENRQLLQDAVASAFAQAPDTHGDAVPESD
jgi:Ser/Thr protein kinase RdoA (MazF antagonist)